MKHSPVEVLAEIERRARALARTLPDHGDLVADAIDYIAFRLEAGAPRAPSGGSAPGAGRLAIPMRDLLEVLPFPEVTRVPGAKPWLLGLTQVRGRLLTVVDLRGFLGGSPSVPGRSRRMLVLDAGDALTGLVVDEVLGIKRGAGPVEPCGAEDAPAWLAGVVAGAVHLEEESWLVFAAPALLADPQFLQAAA